MESNERRRMKIKAHHKTTFLYQQSLEGGVQRGCKKYPCTHFRFHSSSRATHSCESQVFRAKVYGNITHSPSDSLCVVHSLSSLRFFPTICRLSDDGNVILMIIDIEMRRSGVGNATWNVEKIAETEAEWCDMKIIGKMLIVSAKSYLHDSFQLVSPLNIYSFAFLSSKLIVKWKFSEILRTNAATSFCCLIWFLAFLGSVLWERLFIWMYQGFRLR